MAPPVHVLQKPSPSIHENIWEPAAEFAFDEFVTSAKGALRAGRIAVEAAYEIADAHLSNEMLTVPARHRAARDAIFKATTGATGRIQREIERIGSKIAALTGYLKGPPAPKDAVAQLAAIDIRRALSAMSYEDRRKAIIAAIKAGDDSVAVAVLRCAPFVAGLSPEEQEQFAIDWATRRHPTDWAQLAELKRAAENLERGGKLLVSYTAGLTSSHMIEKGEKTEKRAAAATARVGAVH